MTSCCFLLISKLVPSSSNFFLAEKLDMQFSTYLFGCQQKKISQFQICLYKVSHFRSVRSDKTAVARSCFISFPLVEGPLGRMMILLYIAEVIFSDSKMVPATISGHYPGRLGNIGIFLVFVYFLTKPVA